MRTISINTPGPQGPVGPQGVPGATGSAGSSAPFNNVSANTWATTSSLQVTGSLNVTGVSRAASLQASGISTLATTFYYGYLTEDNNSNRIYLNANELDFWTNGSSTMRLTKATKNVLIGTTDDPGYKLHVSGSGNFNNNLTVTGSLTMGGSIFTAGYIGYPNTSRNLQFNDVDGLVRLQGFGGVRLVTYDTTAYTDVVRIDGNVTTRTIQVSGSLRTSGSLTLTGSLNVTSLYTTIGDTAASFVGGVAYVGSNFANVQGNLGVGSFGNPGVRLNVRGSGATSATTALRVEDSNGSASLFVRDDGRVGVGTTSPAYTLDVPNGNIRAQTLYASNWSYDGASPVKAIVTQGVTAGDKVQLADLNAYTGTSNQNQLYIYNTGFNPSSGTGTFNIISLGSNISQSGTATGITRGLYINPIVTSAANFRAIETTTGSVIFQSGSVGIGTTTPAYTLDVNGTARVSTLTLPNFSTITSQNNQINFETVRTIFYASFNNVPNQYSFNFDDGGGSTTLTSGTTGRFQLSSRFAPTTGTAVYNTFLLNTIVNQTGGANGITRGLYINPTLTSAADFRAIETTSGSVSFNHGATSLLFVSSSGNVGISTTTPSHRLHVVGATRLANLLLGSAGNNAIGNTNNDTSINVTNGVGIGGGALIAPSARLHVQGSGATSATTALRVENTNASASLVVRDDNSVEMQGGLVVAGVTGSWIIEARGTSNSGGIRRVGNNVEFYGLNYIGGFIGGYGVLDIRGYSGGSTGDTTTAAATIANSFNYNASSVRTPVLQINPTINQTGTGAFTLLNFAPTINTTGSGINYYISSSNYAVTSLGATISNILTLTPQSPLPSGVATGSFAVSSSVPPKPYFYDGTTWNALY